MTEGVGGTGVVAVLENGTGPTVMVRSDMDGLPIKEESGVEYASKVKQKDLISGTEVYVMHACGHDVHMTSLVGTARWMANNRHQWSGKLMLIGQPAEERLAGARNMLEDNLWDRFGKPDFALAFHVISDYETGRINVHEGNMYAGADTVDLIVHGTSTHGAYPHQGKDPIVLASQIVLALQTLVSRDLPPRDAGLITVGAFNAGIKHNIISNKAELKLTVRYLNDTSRQILLGGIRRIASNLGRAAGLSEDNLPEVIVSNEHVPPTNNDAKLVRRIKNAWTKELGESIFLNIQDGGLGAEDFPYFTSEPYIPSVYYEVGGTPKAVFETAAKGGPSFTPHHSPQFKVDPESSIKLGVITTILALKELMSTD